jgi:outer membrane protein assembly factor BamD
MHTSKKHRVGDHFSRGSSFALSVFFVVVFGLGCAATGLQNNRWFAQNADDSKDVLRHYRAATKFLRRGAHVEATAELRKLERSMRCGAGRLVCKEALVLIGKAALAASQSDEQKALSHLTRAGRLNRTVQKRRRAAGFVDQASLRILYAKGMEELTSGNFEDAVISFKRLAQYPLYMTFARMGKLRLADTLFHQERYLEAVEVYNEFVSLYQQDANVPYARFMAASALVERMPWDNAIFSPAERLDTARTLQAREYLESCLKAAPESPYAFDAMLMLRKVRRRLFRHHRFVADFYGRRGAKRGELGRRMEMALGYPEWGADLANLSTARKLAKATESTTQANHIERVLSIRFPLSITDEKHPDSETKGSNGDAGDKMSTGRTEKNEEIQ